MGHDPSLLRIFDPVFVSVSLLMDKIPYITIKPMIRFGSLTLEEELLARSVAFLPVGKKIIKPPVFELVAAMCHWHIAIGSFESGNCPKQKAHPKG